MSNQVLLVDDDLLMHRMVQHHLEKAGYSLLSATTAQQGLEIAVRELPGLVVLDIIMPDVDGLHVLRELKKADATKNIPVIVITASDPYLARKESEICGATSFLTKPFSPAQLLNEIRLLLPQNS